MTYIKKMVMQGFKSFAKRTEVIFDPAINLIIGANGSGKSLSYDSIVTLADGTEISIGKLVEEQLNSSTEVKRLDDGIYVEGNGSLQVISLNKNTMRTEPKIVSKFIKRQGEDIYKITTRSGRELKATKCHPIMCFSNWGVNSKTISELDVGMLIATPRSLKIESQKEDIDFARLMGYIIGDGYIAENRIDFVNKDTEVLQDFEQLLLQYSKWGIRKSTKGKSQHTTTIYSRDKELYQRIRSLYDSNKKSITSIDKIIPNYFLQLSRKSIANLLAGLFDTDGSVRKDLGIIEYCTKNKDLARQIQSLLLRFDIRSKIKLRMCTAANTITKNKFPYYYLYIYGYENLKRFYESIPLRVQYKKQNLHNAIGRQVVPNENADLLPQEINIKIKEVTELLGIRVKPIKQQYPAFSAYVQNRCAPTRQGIRNILHLFHQKFALLHERYNALTMNQLQLVDFMDLLFISAPQAAEHIGINQATIRNSWAKQTFTGRPQNILRFKAYLSNVFLSRIQKISEILTLLENISNSDIYWDSIVSITKLEKPEFVYDLTIEENHNFIANNIFAHNSNISDALCFALGRLSSKSIRAEKTTSLLFSGTPLVKPAKEACVEVVFDNSDSTFNLPDSEVVITRMVRSNGQGIYKINNEVKTRGDIIEMLAHAGIDPHGFNLILQGQIQAIVKMHTEERRKILEEVSGIAIYEMRKEKSLHELEKTDERLKEINAVLRERKAFLNNLERERSQAMHYKELENTINRCRYSIIVRKISDVQKELDAARKSMEEKKAQRDKMRTNIEQMQTTIDSMTEQIQGINSLIKRSTGVERETLQERITALRAEIEGLKVRIEATQKRKSEFERRIAQLKSSIPEYKKEIEELRKESPILAKKQEELKRKKAELTRLEEEKNKLLSVKTEIYALKERIKEKEARHHRLEVDTDSVLKQIEHISKDFVYPSETACTEQATKLEKESEKIRKELESISKTEMDTNKKIATAEAQIRAAERIKEQIVKIDVCPLCQNKMTQEHITHVTKDSDEKIASGKTMAAEAAEGLRSCKALRDELTTRLQHTHQTISNLKFEYANHRLAKEKQNYLKVLVAETETVSKELANLKAKHESLENKAVDVTTIAQKYNATLREIEEISSRTTQDIDKSLEYKEREFEAVMQNISHSSKDLDELEGEISDMRKHLEDKQTFLAAKEHEEEELSRRFKKLFEDRDAIQGKIQDYNYELSTKRSEIAQVTDQINYIEVGIARLSASRESLEIELKDVPAVDPIKASLEVLQEKLDKTKQDLQSVGAINMRALEVYDSVKDEYDKVYEKVEILQKEKEEILKIVAEIDQKKKRTFLKTFKGINELFTRNASELYSKGKASLKLENEEDMFAGGVDIVIQLGKGKYFDVTSLSGGEQTLIALSLLFAIQEFKPYHFYVFDEIDAALDKRNSERLATLLNKYIRAGQYIIVTHNDALITNSKFLYGVSMHEGVSKVLSLKLDTEQKPEVKKETV